MKTDGFELPDVIAPASVVSVLVVRSGRVAGQHAHGHGARDAVDGDRGARRYGVMSRAMAWLLAPISTQAESPSARVGRTVDAAALKVSAHAASPSETVSVSVTVPGAVQVSVGFCAVALLNVPELVVQWYEKRRGPLSGSCASAGDRDHVPVGGCELTESICGQTLIVPLTRTLPVVGGASCRRWHRHGRRRRGRDVEGARGARAARRPVGGRSVIVTA